MMTGNPSKHNITKGITIPNCKEDIMDIQTITDKINYKTARVQKLQTEIKALETKKTQLENEEIINAVNEANIPISELKNLLTSLKERNGAI